MKTNTLQDKINQLQKLYDAECERTEELRHRWLSAERRVTEFGGYRFDLWCALDELLRNPCEETERKAGDVLAATQNNEHPECKKQPMTEEKAHQLFETVRALHSPDSALANPHSEPRL